jgi:hypothetical protein
MLACTPAISYVIHDFSSYLGTCSAIVSNPHASRASHNNHALPHPILIPMLLWSSCPKSSRSLRLYSNHWWVYMVTVWLYPLVFFRHGIYNRIICLLLHLHSIPIINIIVRVCIITPNCTDCMCTWDTCRRVTENLVLRSSEGYPVTPGETSYPDRVVNFSIKLQH